MNMTWYDKNTQLRKNVSNDFKKDFFKLMNNADFGMTMENVTKRRDIISHRDWKTQIFMNKLVYLSLSILYISKKVMYEFWCNHVKPKYGEKTNLHYMDTDNI